MVTTNQQPEPAFEGWDDAEAPRTSEALIVNLEGFEGPLDLLLALARKVDIAKISSGPGAVPGLRQPAKPGSSCCRLS
jgi:segregation and condensation protein A